MPQRRTEGPHSEYPLVYRPAGFWRNTFILSGAMFIAAGSGGSWFAAASNFATRGSHILALALCLLGILCGAYFMWYALKWKLALLPDRISIHDLTCTTELSRDQISGWRIRPTTPACLVLQRSDKQLSKAKVALTFAIDDRFEQWFEALPCLDNAEAAASAEEIATDKRLGEYPEERTATLVRGRRLARRITAASMMVFAWALFYPRPYAVVIIVLIALPWIAIEILRRSKGLFRVDERPNDAHPSVAYALIFPPLVLALRSVLDYNLFQSTLAFILYAVTGGILVLLAAKFDETLWARKPTFAIFCAIGLTYGYGAVTQANVLLDRSTGVSYSATVKGKHIENGKHISYHLTLTPWGPDSEANDLEVSRATYDPIHCGDTALMTLRKGAFGLNWYYLSTWHREGNPLVCK